MRRFVAPRFGLHLPVTRSLIVIGHVLCVALSAPPTRAATLAPLEAAAVAPVPQAGQYAALAVSATTYPYGYATGMASAEAARAAALAACAKNGGQACTLVGAIAGSSCLSFAMGQSGRDQDWGLAIAVAGSGDVASVPRATRPQSTQHCTDHGGIRCAPQLTLCAPLAQPWTDPTQDQVSLNVATLAKLWIGQMVSDGSPEGLAETALGEAHAMPPGSEFGDFVFGREVHGDVHIGDILHLQNASLILDGTTVQLTEYTAIVARVDGPQLTVVHQGVGGDFKAVAAELNLQQVSQGVLRIYRPIPRFQ